MQKRLKSQYTFNKAVPVGTACICPYCLAPFIKGRYQQVFCKTKPGTTCKDGYWNTVDPKKRNNTTRISPASAAYMTERFNRADDHAFYDDDQSWDAHKDSH